MSSGACMLIWYPSFVSQITRVKLLISLEQFSLINLHWWMPKSNMQKIKKLTVSLLVKPCGHTRCLFFFIFNFYVSLRVSFVDNYLQFRRLQVQEVSPRHPHRPGHQVVWTQSHRLPVRWPRNLLRCWQVLSHPRSVSQDHSWFCDGIRISQLSPVHHQPLFMRQEVNTHQIYIPKILKTVVPRESLELKGWQVHRCVMIWP